MILQHKKSVAPYIKAVVAEAGVAVAPCRAIYTITADAHALTVNDEVITIYWYDDW